MPYRRGLTLFILLALIAISSPVRAARPEAFKAAQPPLICSPTAQVTALVGQLQQGPTGSPSEDTWAGWLRKLSGADPVIINGQPLTITTRYSPDLFSGGSATYTFVRQQLTAWYPTSAAGVIEDDPYFPYGPSSTPWQNLVLTITGTQRPDQIVILSAHLDSTARNLGRNAHGADDNASGAAALLEAARVLAWHPLPRTVRLIWFTGEEQGLLGSRAYAADHPLETVVGDINLDMLAYDGDQDRCFELHVGTLPQSDLIGQCFVQTIGTFNLNLTHDYLTTNATHASDHDSFWTSGVGAVEVGENFYNQNQPGGCTGSDMNPFYHQPEDTIDQIDPAFGFDVSRAALATAFTLAGFAPLDYYLPLVKSSW